MGTDMIAHTASAGSTYYQTTMNQTPPRRSWDPSTLAKIDPKQVEFVLDVEFDALTVHFLGRHHPSVVDPITEHLALLIDGKTREVVGLELREFQTVWVQLAPSLLVIPRFAVIIGLDDELGHVLDDGAPKPLRPLLDWIRSVRYLPAKRAALRTLSALPAC